MADVRKKTETKRSGNNNFVSKAVVRELSSHGNQRRRGGRRR